MPVELKKALHQAKKLQVKSPLPYGPFIWNGTNCSRFVHAVLLAGEPGVTYRVKLWFPYTLTPSPLSNVAALDHLTIISVAAKGISPVCSHPHNVLPEPERTDELPKTVQWLSGEGAGSWFYLEEHTDHYIIARFTEDGSIEYKGIYDLSNGNDFDITKGFRFIHISHHLKTKIIQSGIIYNFNLIQDSESC